MHIGLRMSHVACRMSRLAIAGAAVATLKARSSGTDRMTRGRSHVDDLDDAAMGATWEPPYRG